MAKEIFQISPINIIGLHTMFFFVHALILTTLFHPSVSLFHVDSFRLTCSRKRTIREGLSSKGSFFFLHLFRHKSYCSQRIYRNIRFFCSFNYIMSSIPSGSLPGDHQTSTNQSPIAATSCYLLEVKVKNLNSHIEGELNRIA